MNNRGFSHIILLLTFLVLLVVIFGYITFKRGFINITDYQDNEIIDNSSGNNETPKELTGNTNQKIEDGYGEATPKSTYSSEHITETIDAKESWHIYDGGLGRGSYQIKILPGWEISSDVLMINESPAGSDVKISLTNNTDYVIRIAQGGFSGFECVYIQNDIDENSNDHYFESYKDFTDLNGNNFRRSEYYSNINSKPDNHIEYVVCEYVEKENGYYFPTNTYEKISVYTPVSFEKNILDQIDEMLASLKNTTANE